MVVNQGHIFVDWTDQSPKHMNLGQYFASNVPSLKGFYEVASHVQQGVAALKALSSVMVLLNRYLLLKCFLPRLSSAHELPLISQYVIKLLKTIAMGKG